MVVVVLFLVMKYKIPFQYRAVSYFVGYGIFRFLVEFIRADSRGEIITSILTPSQLVSIALIGVGGLLLLIQKKTKI